MNRVIIVYHRADFDGLASAAIVHKRYSGNVDVSSIKLCGVNYNLTHSLDHIRLTSDDIVVIVDFSFSKERMNDIAQQVQKLIWIDHHSTAIDEIGEDSYLGLSRKDTAACVLTWMYFYRDVPVPESVKLIGEYDIFNTHGEEWEDKVLPFQYGLRTMRDKLNQVWDPAVIGRWDTLFHSTFDINTIIDKGNIILEYNDNSYRSMSLLMFDGVLTTPSGKVLRVKCLNIPMSNSLVFKHVEKTGTDVFITFSITPDRTNVTFYSDTVHCGQIAKEYGGGGHAGAAGCACKKFNITQESGNTIISLIT